MNGIRRVFCHFGKIADIMAPGGGYVAGASHDTILEETPVENVLAMFDTIREYDNYRSGRTL